MGASPEDSRVGEVIGPYELRERVRAGDLSETFRAYDRHGDRWVTLTRLRPEVALRGNVVSEFVRDAEALASIDHPGLVPVSRGEDDLGLPFTVREDVAGELLSSLLERHPKGLELQVAMSIASQIAGALAEVHARGAVHGNPGAGYVLLTDHSGTGAPVLVGFGMSDASAMLGVSPERALAVPPECLMGGEPDASSDVYSFAAMVYEMVSGEAPPAEGAALQAEVDDVPASLSRMVQRCLSAQRERRPSIGELREVLIELAPRKSEFPAPQNIRRISTTFRPPSVPDVAASAPAARPSSADTVTGPEALLDLASELASDPPPAAAATAPPAPAPADASVAGLLGDR
ncbi:MAG: protein kinase, partial [Myxococcales bacterium]|nr:protein kinase [Myxococcales bacterium]